MIHNKKTDCMISDFNYTLFLQRNHFIRNRHIDGRNFLTIYISNGKIFKRKFSISKGLAIANNQEFGSRFHSFEAKSHRDIFIKTHCASILEF